jgi:undecaprenyl-diphosphatase
MDIQIVLWFATHRNAALDVAAQALTVIGRGGLIFVAAALVRAARNRRLAMAAWQVCAGVLVAVLMSDGIIKPIVHRERPYTAIPALEVVGGRPTSEGFPSGHAATCAAAAYVLASTWPEARVGIWVMAALVAVSRVYLGVHYPTDVIGGLLIGLAVGWFVLGRTVWRVRPARSAA